MVGEGRVGEGQSPTSSLTLKDNIWKQAGEEAVAAASHTNPSTPTRAVSGRRMERGRNTKSYSSSSYLSQLASSHR